MHNPETLCSIVVVSTSTPPHGAPTTRLRLSIHILGLEPPLHDFLGDEEVFEVVDFPGSNQAQHGDLNDGQPHNPRLVRLREVTNSGLVVSFRVESVVDALDVVLEELSPTHAHTNKASNQKMPT